MRAARKVRNDGQALGYMEVLSLRGPRPKGVAVHSGHVKAATWWSGAAAWAAGCADLDFGRALALEAQLWEIISTEVAPEEVGLNPRG